jgi:hypothetical protein
MSSAWTPWRKAEWRISTGEVYYETGSLVPTDAALVRRGATSAPTGKPNIPPNKSVPGRPGMAQLVPPVVEGGRFELQKCDSVGPDELRCHDPFRPLKVETRVRTPLGLLGVVGGQGCNGGIGPIMT